MYIGAQEDDPIGLIERALAATVIAEPVEAKLRAAIKEGRLDGSLPPGAGIEVLADRAFAAGIVGVEEARALVDAARTGRTRDPRRRFRQGPGCLAAAAGDRRRAAQAAQSPRSGMTTEQREARAHDND